PGGQLLGWRGLGRFGRRRMDPTGKRLGQALVAGVDRGVDVVVLAQPFLDPSVLIAVWSCIRPGRTAPAHSVRPWLSQTVVALMVFCCFLPEMNARRPQLLIRVRRNWG